MGHKEVSAPTHTTWQLINVVRLKGGNEPKKKKGKCVENNDFQADLLIQFGGSQAGPT